MKNIKFLFVIYIFCILMGHAFSYSSAMTFKEYQNELFTMQEREKKAKEQIAEEQTKIESIKQQINETEQNINNVIKEKYEIIGCTQQDIDDFEKKLLDIKQILQYYLSLSLEDLKKHSKEIQKQQENFWQLKKNPISLLWKMSTLINETEQLLLEINSKMQSAVAVSNKEEKASTYRVKLIKGNRESLHKIAGYDFVFGDPSRWKELYYANKSKIDRMYKLYKRKKGEDSKYSKPEDLIFPGQILTIPNK